MEVLQTNSRLVYNIGYDTYSLMILTVLSDSDKIIYRPTISGLITQAPIKLPGRIPLEGLSTLFKAIVIVHKASVCRYRGNLNGITFEKKMCGNWLSDRIVRAGLEI